MTVCSVIAFGENGHLAIAAQRPGLVDWRRFIRPD